MTECMAIVCEHDGGRLLPDGHRPSKGEVWLDGWIPEGGRWTSLYEETVTSPYPLDARREHERAIVNDESKRGAKAIDPRGGIRLRGGITRTKRGYRFECSACSLDVQVLTRKLHPFLDAAFADGRRQVTLMELQHAGAPAPSPSECS